jgi:cytochrome b561
LPITPAAPRYPAYRIALHWAVVLLIFVQWMTADAIPRTHNPLLPPSATDLLLHAVHNYVGMTIGALVGLRVLLRLLRPVPPVHALASWQSTASATIHWGIYASLLAQAGTGFITSYFFSQLAPVHMFLWNVTLILVAIHVAAALFHAARGDGVVLRMLPAFPGSR